MQTKVFLTLTLTILTLTLTLCFWNNTPYGIFGTNLRNNEPYDIFGTNLRNNEMFAYSGQFYGYPVLRFWNLFECAIAKGSLKLTHYNL